MLSFISFLILATIIQVAQSLPAFSDDISTESPENVLSSLKLVLPGKIQLGYAPFTCQILSQVFRNNETFTTKSPFYAPLYQENWSQTCWLEPACVVTPDSDVEVSQIMTILSVLRTKFAIRSGGHSETPGFNGVGADGVLVALSSLNKLSLSKDLKILTLGPGQRWGPVYEYVNKYNITVLGGRQPMVGVGGLLLGGGLSLFYNTYGVSLNRITRYHVVLPSGRILDATATKNPDLFHALKGGGANFGVVTEFDMETIPRANQIYYEIHGYKPADTPALLDAYAKWTANPKTDIKSNIQLQVTNTITTLFLGYAEHSPQPATFSDFYKVNPVFTLFGPTNGTVLDVTNSPAARTASPGNAVSKTFSHTISDPAFLLEQYSLYRNLSATLPPNTTMQFNPQAILPNFVTLSNSKNGGNMLNLKPVPQMWINIVMQWSDSVNNQLAIDKVDAFISVASARAKQLGLFLPYQYTNDASAKQNPLRSYGDESFNYIKKIAAKYDPAGIMQTVQNSGFLVSKPA